MRADRPTDTARADLQIFREKIKGPSQIHDYFSDYAGPPHDYIQGRDFFQKKFTRLNRSSTKEVYCQCVAPLEIVTRVDQELTRRRAPPIS